MDAGESLTAFDTIETTGEGLILPRWIEVTWLFVVEFLQKLMVRLVAPHHRPDSRALR